MIVQSFSGQLRKERLLVIFCRLQLGLVLLLVLQWSLQDFVICINRDLKALSVIFYLNFELNNLSSSCGCVYGTHSWWERSQTSWLAHTSVVYFLVCRILQTCSRKLACFNLLEVMIGPHFQSV